MRAGAELARRVRPLGAALRRQRRRAAQPRGGASGAQEALGLPIHDNWWQTETGGIMIANYACDGRSGPGSMGRPLPGIEAAIVRARRGRRCSTDGVVELAARTSRASSRCGRAGRRCSAATSRGGALRECFAGGWYLTGDLARRDADGYFWFVGRGDDVIKSAGPPDRPVRGRERADGAPGGRRGRRDRHARPGRRRDRQGVRRAASPASSRATRCGASCSASRRKRLGAGGGAARRSRSPSAAAHAQRQDHAPPAQGARARAARGRHSRRWRRTS